MEINEFNINDNNINKKLEFLYEKYQILEMENKKNKERIQKNEVIIKNLINLLKFLRKEYKEEIKDLKKYILQLFEKLQELLKSNENEKENNEIIMNDKNEDLKIIINIYEEMDKMFDKKIVKCAEEYGLLGKKQKKKKEDKKTEKKEEKKENKKGNKEEEKVELKNLQLSLENKLIKIFFDKNKAIVINDMNDFKKISTAILIKGKQPLEIINKFMDKNIINNFDNEDIKDTITFKKDEIFGALKNFSIINNIEEKDINEYIKKFREKYGITEKDYNDKDLTKLINKKHHDDKNILTEILKKLKYLK